MDELPWDDIHHRSSFLPKFDRFENNFSSIFMIDYVKKPQNPISITNSDSETNLGNISTTFLLTYQLNLKLLKTFI